MGLTGPAPAELADCDACRGWQDRISEPVAGEGLLSTLMHETSLQPLALASIHPPQLPDSESTEASAVNKTDSDNLQST